MSNARITTDISGLFYLKRINGRLDIYENILLTDSKAQELVEIIGVENIGAIGINNN